MLESVSSRGIWPVRVKPKPDEILSSWLTRLCVAHGLPLPALFSAAFRDRVPASHLRAFDFGDSAKADLLDVLAEKTGTPLDRVISTTLREYEGRLYERHKRAAKTLWVLPVGPKVLRQGRGLQYCRQCLLEDDDPYFRRSWRLAFIVFCIKHRMPLSDRCASCGHAVDFHRGFRAVRGRVPSGAITSCFYCRADLREAASATIKRGVSREELEYQKTLMRAVEQGWIDVAGNVTVHSVFYFTGLRKLITILTQRYLGPRFREEISRASGINMFSLSSWGKRNDIEEQNASDRRCLINMVRWLLTGWPDRFVGICRASGLGRDSLLFSASNDFPFWYESVVREHLDRAEYRPPDEEIRSAIAYHKAITRTHQERFSGELQVISTFLRRLKISRLSKKFKTLNAPDLRRKESRKFRVRKKKAT